MLLAGIFLLNAAPVRAQNAVASASSAIREDKAATILQRDMDTLGGLERWSKVKGIRVHGSLQDGEKSGDIVWEDHWGAHYKMVRHAHMEGEDRTYLQNPDRQKPQSTEAAGSTSTAHKTTRPDFDPLSTLTVHSPGAAIALVLNDANYSFSVARPPSSDVRDLDCVRLSRRAAVNSTAPSNVTLCSTHEGKPRKAFIEIANILAPTQRLFETIEYREFRQDQGLVSPQEILLRTPSGRTRKYTFSTIEINPELNANDFQEGVK